MTENTLTQIVARPGGEARSRASALAVGAAVTAAVGAAVFLLGYANGTYPLTTRNAAAIGLLWSLALAAIVAPWTLRALRGLACVPALALLALALLALSSVLWTTNADGAIDEFDLCIFYAAAYVFTLVVVRGTRLAAWRDGIAAGLALVAIVGLVSRLAPTWIGSGSTFDFLPIGYVRLSYPVGYWNALGVLVAVAVPLLLRSATTTRPALLRALAILPIPALAATAYLTSSRNGFLSTAIGIVLLILLSRRRWAVVGAAAAALAGAAFAIHGLLGRSALVNGPLDGAAAVSQRSGAAVETALACVGAALLYAAGVAVAARLPRRPRISEAVPAAVLVLAVAAAVVAAHPIRRFDLFRTTQPPANTSANYVQSHLLSSSANGRWQLWSTALDEYRAHPLLGGGAGSFAEWWQQHRPFVGFVQNAHSLYLEVLAELGPLGVLLIVCLWAAGIVALVRVLRRGDGELRDDAAALAASVLLFAVAAGLDWIWIVPAVTVPALALLALLLRSAQQVDETPVAVRRRRPFRPEAAVTIWAAAAVALGALLYAEAAPLLAQRKIEQSFAAVRGGDLSSAEDDALAAHDLAPWSATPYLQLALIDESAGRPASGRRWIAQAIDRDPHNWQLWLVAARLSAKSGAVPAAREQLARAIKLNPLELKAALG